MISALTSLGDVSVGEFLRDYWQKKPLIARSVFSENFSEISADELAGLSLEDDSDARLIVQGANQWQVKHGPFSQTHFDALPKDSWTLLVRHVDTLDPRVNALRQAFHFLPAWQLDDIMLSYAPDGGGVGPHFDEFDVFLLQGEGQRRWRIGPPCDENTALQPDQPLSLVSKFDTLEEWVLAPGDLLYVPARWAHWGEAVGESITYSIGFRAPSYADLLLDLGEELASFYTEAQRFREGKVTEDPYRVDAATFDTLREILIASVDQPERLAHWFCALSTKPTQSSEGMFEPLEAEALSKVGHCQLNPFSRAAFRETARGAECFVDGEGFHCTLTLAKALCHKQAILFDKFDDDRDQRALRALAHAEKLVEDHNDSEC